MKGNGVGVIVGVAVGVGVMVGVAVGVMVGVGVIVGVAVGVGVIVGVGVKVTVGVGVIVGVGGGIGIKLLEVASIRISLPAMPFGAPSGSVVNPANSAYNELLVNILPILTSDMPEISANELL